MSLASRSVRGAVFLSASTITNIMIGFFGGILLARLLDPNDFGTFALATTLYAFVDIRVKLQLEQKFLRDQDDRPEHLDTFFTLNLGLAGISFLVLLIAAAGVAILNRPDLAICLGVIGLVGLIDPISATIRLSIEKQVAFGAVSLIQTLASLSQFTVTFAGAVFGLGLWSLLLGTSASALLNLGCFLRIAPRWPALRLNRPLAREFLAYGVKYGLVYATSAIVLTQFDNFIIGLIAGTYALGFYDRAYRTSLWPTLLVSAALGRISLPTYSKLQDDPERLGKAFSLVLWTVLTLTTPIALVFLLTAPNLVPTLYGEKWLPSVPILQLLAVFAMFRPLWDDMVSILIATRRSGQMAKVVFIQALVLIALSVPLTLHYGGVGTAMSVGLAFMISAGFLLYFGHTHLKVNLWQTAGRPLLNNCFALAIYLGIGSVLPLDSIVSSLRYGIETAILMRAYTLPSGFTPLMRLGLEGTLLVVLYGLVSLLTSRQMIMSNVRYITRAARG